MVFAWFLRPQIKCLPKDKVPSPNVKGARECMYAYFAFIPIRGISGFNLHLIVLFSQKGKRNSSKFTLTCGPQRCVCLHRPILCTVVIEWRVEKSDYSLLLQGREEIRKVDATCAQSTFTVLSRRRRPPPHPTTWRVTALLIVHQGELTAQNINI